MVKTLNLTYTYNSSKALHFPNISLEKEDDLLILGNSGRGKTTLLHLLGGLLRPSAGEIHVDGDPLHEMSAKKLDQFRGRHIGLIFQKPYFVKALTIKDNLVLTQKLGHRKVDTKQISEILNRLNILEKANRLPATLSVGEQQRASIARAILNEPSIILADEPTSALDDDNAAVVAELLKENAQLHKANLIVVTHDNRLKAKFQNTLQL